MRKTSAIVLALAVAAGLPSPALAAADIHWGPVRSAAGHAGHARADVWITGFDVETFVVRGRLYDRDRHPGHCARIRARFHYAGGGTGWSRPRTSCSAVKPFRLSSDGEIRRVDVRVCLYDRGTRKSVKCHADAITPEIIANWPQ